MTFVQRLASLLIVGFSTAQAQQELPLWPGGNPLFGKPHAVQEYVAPCWGANCAYDVVKASLTVYPPTGEGNGNLVLVVPGGGYDVVAIFHEGSEIAEGLARRGTAAAVLKYRLPDTRTATAPEKVPLADLHQAMRMLREQQAELGVSAERIGVMGFSAGAHLATVASLEAVDNPALKPDFSMLIYGVTRLSPENLKWLEDSLYHRKLTAAEIERETLLERVTGNTPPSFV